MLLNLKNIKKWKEIEILLGCVWLPWENIYDINGNSKHVGQANLLTCIKLKNKVV